MPGSSGRPGSRSTSETIGGASAGAAPWASRASRRAWHAWHSPSRPAITPQLQRRSDSEVRAGGGLAREGVRAEGLTAPTIRRSSRRVRGLPARAALGDDRRVTAAASPVYVSYSYDDEKLPY